MLNYYYYIWSRMGFWKKNIQNWVVSNWKIRYEFLYLYPLWVLRSMYN